MVSCLQSVYCRNGVATGVLTEGELGDERRAGIVGSPGGVTDWDTLKGRWDDEHEVRFVKCIQK